MTVFLEADMSKMRRPIKVYGAELDNGSKVTTEDPEIVTVTIHPDRSVSTTNLQGKSEIIEGQWVSYARRL